MGHGGEASIRRLVDAPEGRAYRRPVPDLPAPEVPMSPRPIASAVRILVAAASIAALSLAVASPAAAASTHASGKAPKATRGYDVSWPQCGGSLPSNPLFGIVGVNKGIVFSANPCLATEIHWAGGTRAQLYANTGNPGPQLSSHWPTGQATPRTCSATSPDTADCAFDYGWNAARDSYADASAAWSSLALGGSPAASPWWLDVETGNSWRTDTTLNVAALQGAVAGLQSEGVSTIGVYSTQYQWTQITGGSSALSANASWIAGASSLRNAQSRCAGPSFTGGRVALVQYPASGFDADLAC